MASERYPMLGPENNPSIKEWLRVGTPEALKIGSGVRRSSFTMG
jgi:hypothetical protein